MDTQRHRYLYAVIPHTGILLHIGCRSNSLFSLWPYFSRLLVARDGGGREFGATIKECGVSF